MTKAHDQWVLTLDQDLLICLRPSGLRDSSSRTCAGDDKQPFLAEDEMERLRPFFLNNNGKPRVDDQRVLIGIISLNRNDLQWCDAPQDYGPHKTPHDRWKRGAAGGLCPDGGGAGLKRRRGEGRHDRRDPPQGAPF